ncbi:hypothetical protein FRC01_009038, partial [Tulasnella sp. 417]
MVVQYINQLPAEIWVLVINFLYDTEYFPERKALALKSVRLTCRRFRDLAVSMFWRRVVIDFDRYWKQVYSALEEDERKRNAAHLLVVKYPWDHSSAHVGTEGVQVGPQAKSKAVQLKNLQEIKVFGGGGDTPWRSFLEQNFNFPALKVWTLVWADISRESSTFFTPRLSTLVIQGCPSLSFQSNPEIMCMLTRLPNLRDLRIHDCHLSGYSKLKNDRLRSNLTQPLGTSPIEILRLRPFRSYDPIYLTEINTFINDCPKLRELDMTECWSRCLTDGAPPVALEKLEEFRGHAAVAALICKGLPVSDIRLSVGHERPDQFLADLQDALTAGSVPISRITIPDLPWNSNVVRVISKCCRDLEELNCYGHVEKEGRRNEMNPGNSIDLQELVSLLSGLPRLEILRLVFYGYFPQFEVEDQAWESVCLAEVGDGIKGLRSVQFC